MIIPNLFGLMVVGQCFYGYPASFHSLPYRKSYNLFTQIIYICITSLNNILNARYKSVAFSVNKQRKTFGNRYVKQIWLLQCEIQGISLQPCDAFFLV